MSEQFLAAFHDAHPGITSRAFAYLSVVMDGRRFASSYECMASEIAQDDGPRTLLDLACGDGFLLSLFAARAQPGLSLIGVDLSEGELAAARRRLGDAATLKQGRAQALPLATGTVDHAVCHMALMLMEDMETVLAEVRRVLKKGAVFAAVVGARPPPSPLFELFSALLAEHPRDAAFSGVRFGDRRLRSPEGISELFSTGFEGVQVTELLAQRRSTPEALCAWFGETYDFHMLAPDSRRELSAAFIAAALNHCAADGQLDYCHRFHLITATAA